MFLDANIFFTATLSQEGGSALLFKLAKGKHLKLVSSLYALEEAKRNLQHKVGEECIPYFLNLVSLLSHADQSLPSQEEVDFWDAWLAQKDIPVLLSALKQKADVLVTLDRKDFMSARMQKAPLKLLIQTPGDFLLGFFDYRLFT